jgi:hypothetical protein
MKAWESPVRANRREAEMCILRGGRSGLACEGGLVLVEQLLVVMRKVT